MRLPEEVAERIRAAHSPSWLTVLAPHEAATFDDVARLAGLEPLGREWHEVDRAAAAAILTALLSRSLAYDVELMPAKTAAWLAEDFLDAPGTYEVRYASNSATGPTPGSWSWTPATDHMADCGIVAMGPAGSALFWVADDD